MVFTCTEGVSRWGPGLTLSTNLEPRALVLVPTLTTEATLCCITKDSTWVWAVRRVKDKSFWCKSYSRACHGWNTSSCLLLLNSFRAFFTVLVVEIRVFACLLFKRFSEFFSHNFVFVLVLNMHHYFFLLTVILGMIRSSSWIKYNSLQIVCSFFAIGKSYPGNCIIGEVTDSWTCHIIMHRILCHVIILRLISCS